MRRNMYVKKIMTFKSGNFAFSRKYSIRKMEPLIIESRVLNETLKDLPILPELSAQINQEIIKRSIFGTAAIEGNPLTEEKVSELIDDIDQKTASGNHEIEIRNLKAAYEVVKAIKTTESEVLIDEKLIKKLHETITHEVDIQENNPGHYRNHRVQVGDKSHGGVYTPPKCLPDIENLMTEYIQWINSPDLKKIYPPIRAALAHFHFGLIHPFGDGNGRTARLIEAIIIQASGFKYTPVMLSNYYYKYIDDYFWAFSKAIKSRENDVTDFLYFIIKAFISALKEIKGKVVYFIRIFSMRDYFTFLKTNRDITQRQFDFLNILLDYLVPFTLSDLYEKSIFSLLYRDVSSRTARRDLKKLEGMRLLKKDQNKQYELDLEALG